MPPGLIESILKAAHDDSGHNGFPRTYSAIRRLYYWKGIKEDVRQHCTNCYTFQLHRTATVKFEAKHFKPGMRPMDFIAMDLIGEFHPPSSQGNRYALTGICMLTGFTWCIPLKLKKAAEVSRTYLQHCKVLFAGFCRVWTFYQSSCCLHKFFPGFLVPRCALLFWGIFVRGLHVETFVRVLRSSRCRLLIKCK